MTSDRISPSGPIPARIMFVGEAPGKEEDLRGKPFVGSAGKELRRMAQQAGIAAGLVRIPTATSFVVEKIDESEQSCYMTNVFMTWPGEGNKIDNFCAKKEEVGGKAYTHLPLSQGKYVKPEYLFELDRLAEEIRQVRPDLIVALGNVPCWALLGQTGITRLRGNLFDCTLVPGYKVIPTYHPAYILRAWHDRVIAVQDLIKCKRFVDVGFSPPHRELWLDPTIEEFEEFVHRFIIDPDGRPLCDLLSVDVETKGGTVTCIGFAPNKTRSITVPFYDPRNRDRNYWPTAALERRAWDLVKDILQSPAIPKVGQNGLYDIQYCHKWGIQVIGYLHDTMIRHHSLYPEMEKGLGFMGSIYTDEAPWKIMRPRSKDTMMKLEDE